MDKYYVDYYTKDGDFCHIWVNASSKEQAENIALHDYWDIDMIVDIRKA